MTPAPYLIAVFLINDIHNGSRITKIEGERKFPNHQHYTTIFYY